MTTHKEWHPLKKALWDVIVAEEINSPNNYVNAWDLTEKLYLAALAQAETQPVAWQPIETAPKGEVTEDAGCRGTSEWFLGRVSKEFRKVGAAPFVVIRRRAWPQEDSWVCNGEAHYVPRYFDAWMPLSTSSTPADGEDRAALVQHVEWGDWTVDDTDTAREILNYLGLGDDASREPGADRRRDKIAEMIRTRIDAEIAAAPPQPRALPPAPSKEGSTDE